MNQPTLFPPYTNSNCFETSPKVTIKDFEQILILLSQAMLL